MDGSGWWGRGGLEGGDQEDDEERDPSSRPRKLGAKQIRYFDRDCPNKETQRAERLSESGECGRHDLRPSASLGSMPPRV